MFSPLRKCLVTFLVLLQLVAPLVHAHAGKIAFALPTANASKLHVPGLEMLVMAEENSAQYTTAILDAPSEGIIFSVDTGIKQSQDNGPADPDNSYYLHQKTVVFTTAASPPDNNFSPQATAFICRLPVSSHTPRAPPAR